jgi:tocopherol O-methyltransferase
VTTQVQEYYERNTGRFLRYGGGERVGAIHRKLWGPGVQTTDEALLFINQWVVDRLRQAAAPSEKRLQYLDVGCGVGGTSVFVADRLGAKVLGTTISPYQAHTASLFAERKQQGDACSFVVADFQTLPVSPDFQGSYAIESFTHSTNPEELFQQVSNSLKPGARFLIVDDMLCEHVDDMANSRDRARWQQLFKRGWHLHALLTPGEIQVSAQKAGLDLLSISHFSSYIKSLQGFRSIILKWFARLPLPGSYWQSVRAGIALQVCISQGWIEYNGLVFEKS